MVIRKTKISKITAIVATIAIIAALGSIGGGMGLGQQQMALAQADLSNIGVDVGDIGDSVRDIVEDELDRVGEIQNIIDCEIGEVPVLIQGQWFCIVLFAEPEPDFP
jgi:hypothetical protein